MDPGFVVASVVVGVTVVSVAVYRLDVIVLRDWRERVNRGRGTGLDEELLEQEDEDASL